MPTPLSARQAFAQSFSSKEHTRLEWKASYRLQARNVMSPYQFPLMTTGKTYKTTDLVTNSRIIVVGTPAGNIVLVEKRDDFDAIHVHTDDDLFSTIAVKHLLGVVGALRTGYEVQRILGNEPMWPNIGVQIVKLFEYTDARKY